MNMELTLMIPLTPVGGTEEETIFLTNENDGIW
jgi:hypothetical protein